MDLYNVRTRQKEEIEDKRALHEAILNRTHSYKAGQLVNIRKDDSDDTYTVPSENLADAIRAGYQIETTPERIIREFKRDNEGLAGALGVASGQLVNQLGLGLPELFFDKLADPLLVAKKDALKDTHELANLLGGIGGFGASVVQGGLGTFAAASKTGQAVENIVAKKLGAITGEQVGSRTLKDAARDLVARTAGTGAEGLVLGLPHAASEAVLGDPIEAGEHILGSVGLGALFGAATGLGGEFLGLGKKVAKDVRNFELWQDETRQSITRKITESFTGVKAEDIEYYLKNTDKVNKAPSLRAITDLVEGEVGKQFDKLQALKDQQKNVQNQMRDAYKFTRREMANTRAPVELADSIIEAINNENVWQGETSRLADAILGTQRDVTYSKKEILKLIKEAQGVSKQVGVGEEVIRARKRMQDYAKRIEELPGDELDIQAVGRTIKELNRDLQSSYEKRMRESGTYDAVSDRQLKNFSAKLREVIRSDSPEYAALMDEMSRRAQATQNLKIHFKNTEQGQKSIESIVSPKGSDVKRRALEDFSRETGNDFSSRLNELQDIKKTLERSQTQDLTQLLVPDLWNRNKQLERAVFLSEQQYQPLERLRGARAEQGILNMGRKRPNLSVKRAFEALESQTGVPFQEMIRDRLLLESFNKQIIQGSRRVKGFSEIASGGLGLFLGAKMGGAVGGVAGGLAGLAVDTYGGRLVKSLLDAKPSWAGMLFVEKAMKQNAQKIDKLPEILRNISEGKYSKDRTIATDALFRIFNRGEAGKKESEEHSKQIKELSNKLGQILSDPETFADFVDDFSVPLRQGGAPKIADGFSMVTLRALSYLYDNIPKPPAPSGPFTPDAEWQPSDFEINRFAHILQIAEDPFKVLEEYEEGSLVQNHVDALQAMYPSLHQRIQQAVVEIAADKNIKLDYQQRVQLSILAGFPVDNTLTAQGIVKLQKNYLLGRDELGREPQEQMQQDFVPKRQINIAENEKTRLQSVSS